MQKTRNKNQMILFHSRNGEIILRGDLKKETIWANLNQIAQLFDADKTNISKHIDNIFKTKELQKKRTIAKIATVQLEGKRQIKRSIEYYNLDVIISVGYKVNSKKATKFRQWATKTLREYITGGFVMNKKWIAKNYQAFLQTVENIKQLLPKQHEISASEVLDLISAFSDTWFSLESYDKDRFINKGMTKKQVELTADKLSSALHIFKTKLVEKGEASDLFGRERNQNSVDGIVGNVMQSFAQQDVYASVEEKAAHLLYFIIKDHPFVDGNKRSGAYAFLWFLQQAGILNTAKMNPSALTALALLIAESNPKHKDKIVGLVMQLL